MKHPLKISVSLSTILFAAAVCGANDPYVDNAMIASTESTDEDTQSEVDRLGIIGRAEHEMLAYCNGFPYDPNSAICCNGAVWSKNIYNACCGPTPYIADPKLVCCGGLLWNGLPSSACCGKNPYDTTKNLCCEGNVWSKGLGTKCCGSFPCF